MADYRLSAKIIGRGSGRSSVAAAAYRAGAQLHDERTGLDHDYTRKNGVLHTEIMSPDDAPDWMKNRAKLWNAVEAVERRKDAQLAREIQLSLPHELTEAQNKKLVQDFIQSHFVDRGMIADLAIHAPDRQGDQRNIHAHVMLTTRVLTSDGFGNKNRDWNKKDQLETWREAWADHQNEAFKDLGFEHLHVDHRSYADQGIDREPTQHLGHVANDMEKNGKASRIGDENRERQARNEDRAALAQEAAQTTRDLAKENARQDEQANVALAQSQSYALDQQIEQERRQDREMLRFQADWQERNGQREQMLQAEQARLEQQLAADGWRKLMRDFLGKTKRDQQELFINQQNLTSMRQREAEERQAIQARHDAEREANRQADLQRDAEITARNERARIEAQKQAVEARERVAPPIPANDHQEPPERQPHAPEHDNTPPVQPDFKDAVRQRSIDEHKERIREKLRDGRGRDGYEID